MPTTPPRRRGRRRGLRRRGGSSRVLLRHRHAISATLRRDPPSLTEGGGVFFVAPPPARLRKARGATRARGGSSSSMALPRGAPVSGRKGSPVAGELRRQPLTRARVAALGEQPVAGPRRAGVPAPPCASCFAEPRGRRRYKNTPPLRQTWVARWGRGDGVRRRRSTLSKDLPADGNLCVGRATAAAASAPRTKNLLEPAQGVRPRARTPGRHAVDALVLRDS